MPLPTWAYTIGVLVEGAGATGVVVTPAVGAVHDGRDGLARALAGTYAAVILDVMLPGMSGFDVVRELRRRRLRAEDLLDARTPRSPASRAAAVGGDGSVSRRSCRTGGVGLGLATVRSAVEACGGKVSCRNLQPRGLEVRLELPRG